MFQANVIVSDNLNTVYYVINIIISSFYASVCYVLFLYYAVAWR
jgi:hypothetical protein